MLFFQVKTYCVHMYPRRILFFIRSSLIKIDRLTHVNIFSFLLASSSTSAIYSNLAILQFTNTSSQRNVRNGYEWLTFFYYSIFPTNMKSLCDLTTNNVPFYNSISLLRLKKTIYSNRFIKLPLSNIFQRYQNHLSRYFVFESDSDQDFQMKRKLIQ